MKGKDPAVLFYTKDWLVDTMGMTYEEKGIYIDLLCLQHQNGHLPKRQVEGIPEAVREKFKEDEEGLFYNPRMDREKKKRAAYAVSRSQNGKKGGRPKKEEEDSEKAYENHMESTAKPYGYHMESISKAHENHTGNGNENENANTDADVNLKSIRARIKSVSEKWSAT